MRKYIPSNGGTTGGGVRKPPINAPPHVETDTRAYQRDIEERQRMESREWIIQRATLQRIHLGEVQSSASPGLGGVEVVESYGCGDHAGGYIWGLGKRPTHTRGPLKLVTPGKKEEEAVDGVYEQLMPAMERLRRRAIPLEEGPYADKDGLMVKFTDTVLKGVKDSDLIAIIERLIDIRPSIPSMPELEERYPRKFRSGYNFVYNEQFMAPDVLPTAGEILSQESRRIQNRVTGAFQFTLDHTLDNYILAVSALRRRGYTAFIAHAIEDEDSMPAPVIAVVNPKQEFVLTTFDMIREHPRVGALDLISDTALLGATYTMLAKARTDHLTAEMVKQWREHQKSLSLDEIRHQLERIAYCIAECSMLWHGSIYIPLVTQYLYRDLVHASLAIDERTAMQDPESELIQTPAGIRHLTFAESNSDRFVRHMQNVLGRLLEHAVIEPEDVEPEEV